MPRMQTMKDHYERQLIRIRPRSWRAVIERITGPGAEAVEKEGGRLFGLFSGQIGLSANEGIVITAWPDTSARESPILTGVEDVLESKVERLIATVRPTEPAPPTKPGVYAHRRFEIQERDWPEFLDLSESAWPSFESDFGVEVVGFWRSLDVEPPRARVFLLTYYPDLSTWERSRRPTKDARERFVRRHELTEHTVVVTTELRSR